MAAAPSIRYFLDPEDAIFEHNNVDEVGGNISNSILLRNKRELAIIPNTIDIVEVSPVSANSGAPAELKGGWNPLLEFYIIAGCCVAYLLIVFVIWAITSCIECCCGPQVDAWARRRQEAAARRRREVAMAQWGRQPILSLRTLSSRTVIAHTKRPVKRNLQKLELPQALASELVELRKNGHPIAGENRGAQGI